MCEIIVHTVIQILLNFPFITVLEGYSFSIGEKETQMYLCVSVHVWKHAWCMIHFCLLVIFESSSEFIPRVHMPLKISRVV